MGLLMAGKHMVTTELVTYNWLADVTHFTSYMFQWTGQGLNQGSLVL